MNSPQRTEKYERSGKKTVALSVFWSNFDASM